MTEIQVWLRNQLRNKTFYGLATSAASNSRLATFDEVFINLLENLHPDEASTSFFQLRDNLLTLRDEHYIGPIPLRNDHVENLIQTRRVLKALGQYGSLGYYSFASAKSLLIGDYNTIIPVN